MRKQLIILMLWLAVMLNLEAKCQGKFLNPVTDICWSCIFPITLGGLEIMAGKDDAPNPKKLVCVCPKPPAIPVPGVPVSFWEPARLVDVTRSKYCMVNMGLQIQSSHKLKGAGSVATVGGGQAKVKHGFYQVHWYVYPIIQILQLITDFACLELRTELDIAYLTEIDPLWDDDQKSLILNPEAVLFANPIAQAACAADCLSATSSMPLDPLFWCGGCQGSLYPFTGSISAHIGGVQASLLLTQRMIAKLHREFLLWGYMGELGLCDKYQMPIMRKSQYKTQMTYPIPVTTGCQPLGRSEVIWGSGKEFPYKGEDFGYLIWRKRNCCLL